MASAAAADDLAFPKLTGRVVDEAGLLSPSTARALDERLAAHERATSNQVVVVTLRSLQGRSIEEVGYQLGRHWGIGQEGQDNGALLIVAPNERQVRIEVGYGLEGTLTDAICSNVIHAVILPAFRSGDVEGGIVAGAEAVIEALGGQYRMREGRPRREHGSAPFNVGMLIFLVFVALTFGRSMGGGRRLRGRRGGVFIGPGFGGGGGGFGGGGFGGGGGGFGGGGASGGW